MQRLRVTLARIAIAVIALGASLGLAEVAVRTVLPQHDPSGQLSLAERDGLWLGPGSSVARQTKNTGDYDVLVRFGPRGFRDARDVASAGAQDVLFVGDSFTFGWGVEEPERFSSRFEALRGERAFNVAIPGGHVPEYERRLRYAERLGARASRLVIGLSLETDVFVDPSMPQPETPAGEASPGHHAAKDWLAERSALYRLATTGAHRTPWLRALAVRAGWIVPNLAGVVPPTASEQDVGAVADAVLALARGYDATVLLIPSRALWLGEHATQADREHRAVTSALHARGLRVVDVRAAFEATGTPLGLHFAHDGHWNAQGHRIAAELLARAVPRMP